MKPVKLFSPGSHKVVVQAFIEGSGPKQEEEEEIKALEDSGFFKREFIPVKYIEIKCAKQNNLKAIDVKIPLGEFTVVCGPSGSGKSSLAFETLFAEGQRHYTETLSNYARQYIQECPKPLVDQIVNIPPTLALEQNNSVRSSRPTVATLTEVADCLRLLFTYLASPVCPVHNEELVSFSPVKGAKKIVKDLDRKKRFIIDSTVFVFRFIEKELEKSAYAGWFLSNSLF